MSIEKINQFTFTTGEKIKKQKLIQLLVDFGYQKSTLTNSIAEFSDHGSLVRIFAVNHQKPLSIDFFGDRVDLICFYNQKNLKKIIQLKSATIFANKIKTADGFFSPGDYLVHIDHGIGIFSGLTIKEIGNQQKLFLIIEYEDQDKLFLPLELTEKVAPYFGVSNRKPRLSRLRSTRFQNTKKKVFESLIKLSSELIEIAAKRELIKAVKIRDDSDWQKRLSRSFPHTETRDQQQAIDEVYADLKSEKPMDRLIIGDVGFGKTEIALRALLLAVAGGYQVAMIAPTTILVEQHFLNFKNRLDEFPISLEKLSRFGNNQKNFEIVDRLAGGQVDAIIGTHRLLSQDIKFKNLALLIIDEEQKFGVKDKEKLKKIRENINVLTISATPIPRTLFSSISGLRSISRIQTPPNGRKPIATEIIKFNPNIIKKYICRELNRKGQIYYLHNEIETIIAVAKQIRKLVPRIRIVIAHGRLSKETLAKNMADFAGHKYDLLLCTTIIENGLDLPKVNTLIVENADRFGLSDLYQIRGRIGRSEIPAYSLFLINQKKITDNARKRLSALAENNEIGQGFTIAYRDLEIRGGGNLLGREQHGNMEAIGLALYSKLLEQAVNKVKGGAKSATNR